MASILKVDTLQKPDGSTPTAADLGLDVAGSVVQVVSDINTTYNNQSTTSQTAVSTGASLSITPKYATSKILICFTVGMSYSATNDPCIIEVRDQNNNILTGGGYDNYQRSGSAGMYNSNTLSVEAVPNTTSTQTYTIFMRSGSGGLIYGLHGGSYYHFIVQEIAQ